jgi:hypothetical protein
MIFAQSININAFKLLIQNETKNLKRENGSTPSLSEDIYSIQDNVLGGKYPIVGHMQNRNIFVCVLIL